MEAVDAMDMKPWTMKPLVAIEWYFRETLNLTGSQNYLVLLDRFFFFFNVDLHMHNEHTKF